MRGSLSALVDVHKNVIGNQDLESASIVFENNSPEAEINFIDFGIAARFAPDGSIMKVAKEYKQDNLVTYLSTGW